MLETTTSSLVLFLLSPLEVTLFVWPDLLLWTKRNTTNTGRRWESCFPTFVPLVFTENSSLPWLSTQRVYETLQEMKVKTETGTSCLWTSLFFSYPDNYKSAKNGWVAWMTIAKSQTNILQAGSCSLTFPWLSYVSSPEGYQDEKSWFFFNPKQAIMEESESRENKEIGKGNQHQDWLSNILESLDIRQNPVLFCGWWCRWDFRFHFDAPQDGNDDVEQHHTWLDLRGSLSVVLRGKLKVHACNLCRHHNHDSTGNSAAGYLFVTTLPFLVSLVG